MQRLLSVVAMFALVILLAGYAAPPGRSYGGAPSYNVVEGCDPYGSDPECVTDDTYWSMNADQTAGYVDRSLYSNGICYTFSTTRSGTGGWWNVRLSFVACYDGQRVTRLYSVVPTAWSGLPFWLKYAYSLDWGLQPGTGGTYGVGTDTAYSWMQFHLRFCGWVRCAGTVYPWIWIYVTGDGRSWCYSDKSVVYGCRGQRFGP